MDTAPPSPLAPGPEPSEFRPAAWRAPACGPAALLLAGPTGVGKSETALLLAQRLDGEIVSVDSMQVYKGMDIGTAKPSKAEQGRVAHHLIDILEPRANFDAAQFLQRARQAVAEIAARGRLPILCGGTGLYFKVYLAGLSQTPAVDLALRAQLNALPLAQLLEELAQADPVAYERIDRQNPRRVIRAVEVMRLTGKPFSQQRVDWQAAGPAQASQTVYCLTRPLPQLHQRIEQRVEQMFEGGLVAETQGLMKQGLELNSNAMQALGYRQVADYLQGAASLAQTIELVKLRTRQFAHRQLKWFKRQLPVEWLALEATSSAEQSAQAIAQRWQAALQGPAGSAEPSCRRSTKE